jgi:lipopolysaccharide transport system ATP-binding protein
MSADTPIVFENVWKKFWRGEWHNSLRDLVPALITRPFRRRQGPPPELAQQEFWAVKDVSFAVRRGEALGIIGPNGAGKSTTLKMLTRILRPTRGRSVVSGRVGALIEIAAGFHPDLTGKENIYLQGAIMGMRRAEITSRLDEIIEFASVSEFIDTQVKRYSSGMNARLGFAIAAHLNPDVLIIDEVLSVGDMAFQRKCIDRMARFKKEGVAVVFVSHNLQAVTTLCDRALYLHHETRALAPVDEVITKYIEECGGGPVTAPDTKVLITSAELLDDGAPAMFVKPGGHLTLRVQYLPKETFSDVTFGFLLYRSTDQLVVYDGHFEGAEVGQAVLRKDEPFTVDFNFRAHLTRGHYHLECHVYNNLTQVFLARVVPIANFAVQETRTYKGIADLDVVPITRDERAPQPALSTTERAS